MKKIHSVRAMIATLVFLLLISNYIKLQYFYMYMSVLSMATQNMHNHRLGASAT